MSKYEGFKLHGRVIKIGNTSNFFYCPSGPKEIIKNGINGFLVKYEDLDDLNRKNAGVNLILKI